MEIARTFRHLCATQWGTRRRFSPEVLGTIEAAIREVESKHAGEVRFAVETSFDIAELWHEVTPRQRALQVFGHLGVWDTQHNAGVLIYVLMADRDVEIVADRGIAARVSAAEWEAVCREIEGHYQNDRFAEGSVAGIRRVGELLAKYFPNAGGDRDELPNQPVLL
jgi:uncharacterized membrane protein